MPLLSSAHVTLSGLWIMYSHFLVLCVHKQHLQGLRTLDSGLLLFGVFFRTPDSGFWIWQLV